MMHGEKHPLFFLMERSRRWTFGRCSWDVVLQAGSISARTATPALGSAQSCLSSQVFALNVLKDNLEHIKTVQMLKTCLIIVVRTTDIFL
jgi:hypothetical protein